MPVNEQPITATQITNYIVHLYTSIKIYIYTWFWIVESIHVCRI